VVGKGDDRRPERLSRLPIEKEADDTAALLAHGGDKPPGLPRVGGLTAHSEKREAQEGTGRKLSQVTEASGHGRNRAVGWGGIGEHEAAHVAVGQLDQLPRKGSGLRPAHLGHVPEKGHEALGQSRRVAYGHQRDEIAEELPVAAIVLDLARARAARGKSTIDVGLEGSDVRALAVEDVEAEADEVVGVPPRELLGTAGDGDDGVVGLGAVDDNSRDARSLNEGRECLVLEAKSWILLFLRARWTDFQLPRLRET
jgi:hypothetical protein